MALSSRAIIVFTSSTAIAATVWKILQWRARQRATKIVRQVRDYMKEDGPLVRTLLVLTNAEGGFYRRDIPDTDLTLEFLLLWL
jgi:hypothetical protein